MTAGAAAGTGLRRAAASPLGRNGLPEFFRREINGIATPSGRAPAG
jgi:hypothetical protein